MNAASFVISAALLRGLPTSPAAASGSGRRLGEVAEGLGLIRGNRFLNTLAGVQLLAALSAGATSALLVVLADRHLDVGPSRFGFLIGAIGVGAGLGPLVLRRLIADPRRPSVLFGPYLLRGGVDFPRDVIELRGGAGSTGRLRRRYLDGHGHLQQRVADHGARSDEGSCLRLLHVVWQGARLVSIAVGGVLADAIGVRAVYVFGGTLLLVAGALGLARLRSADLAEAAQSLPVALEGGTR